MYNTPAQTNIKAKNVPTEVKSTKKSILKNNAGIATTKPVTIVANDGVLYLGWIVANFFHNKPSRLIVIQMRGCANWNTNNALVIAITDVTEISPAIWSNPTYWKTEANGSFTFNSV